jgi:hypothetical protein
MDTIGQWFEERCEVDSTKAEPAGELYRDYCGWVEDRREHPVGQRSFGLWLGRRDGLERAKISHAWRWRGVALRPVNVSVEHGRFSVN